MGHANISITLDRYGHLMPGSEEEAAGRLDQYIAQRAPFSRQVTPNPGSSRLRGDAHSRFRAQMEATRPYEPIARLVRSRRRSLDMTQQELAERAGTSHSLISRIESGEHAASVSSLQRLAEAFDVPLVVGFGEDPSADAFVTA